MTGETKELYSEKSAVSQSLLEFVYFQAVEFLL